MDELENDNIANQEKKETYASSIEEFDEFLTEETIEKEDEVPFDSQIVKLNWFRVFFISFLLTIFAIGVTLLVLLIISRNKPLIFIYSPWFFLIECGLFLTFGGCIGTFKQSFTISYLRNRFFKTDKITGADTKLAIASSYTYVFVGILLGLASILAWLAVS
ncbi:MAG: hypothetical protein FK730_00435 [Asgard group archaeon]|nr:hypothetical protein [Asgard group archaeon]